MKVFAISSDVKNFADASISLRKYLRRRHIGSVLLGVSGGADSVLALHLLADAAREIPKFRLYAAHANFRLRGSESQRDEDFVRMLSKIYPHVDFFFTEFDTSGYAREKSVSIEMAARELRHSWWESLKTDNDISYIATGHNANDNEETLLLNLLRGSSPAGLRGMSTFNGKIFRPLLGLFRKDILRLTKDFISRIFSSDDSSENPHLGTSKKTLFEKLLRQFPDGYVTDSSNLGIDYRRNFLRHEILPRLESRWEGLHSAMLTSLDLQAEAASIIDQSVNDILNSEALTNPYALQWTTILCYPAPMTLIYYFAKAYGLTSSQAREIAGHIPSGRLPICQTPGRRWLLPDGAEILTTPDSLQLRLPQNSRCFTEEPAVTIEQDLPNSPELMRKIRQTGPEEVYLPQPIYCYEWRRPLPGERIRLFPSGGKTRSKLISDVLKEAGVVVAQRSKILLLANKSSGEAVWIPGIRRAGTDLINNENSQIYHIVIRK